MFLGAVGIRHAESLLEDVVESSTGDEGCMVAGKYFSDNEVPMAADVSVRNKEGVFLFCWTWLFFSGYFIMDGEDMQRIMLKNQKMAAWLQTRHCTSLPTFP